MLAILAEAANALGCTVDSLKRKPVPSLRTVKAIAPLLAKLRDDKMPGDLESAIQHQGVPRDMFQEEPGTEILSAIGKYEPFRAALLKAWTKHSHWATPSCPAVKPSSCLAHAHSRGQKLLQVLQACLPDMDGDKQEVWSTNCGRGVARVLGWLAMMGEAQLGIIRSVDHTKAGIQVFKLGATGRKYILDMEGEPTAVERLAKICKAADTTQAVRRSLAGAARSGKSSGHLFDSQSLGWAHLALVQGQTTCSPGPSES